MSGVEADIGRLYDIRECRPLTDDQLRPGLTVPLAQRGIPAEPAAVEALLQSANGSPQRLQLLGAAAMEMARPPAGVNAEVAEVAIGNVNAQSAMLYEAAWNNSTDGEKDLMARAAVRGQRGLSVPSVTQAAGPDQWAAVDASRQSLKARGVMRESDGSERMRFADPGMQQWVRAHVGQSAAHLGVQLPTPGRQQGFADQGARQNTVSGVRPPRTDRAFGR